MKQLTPMIEQYLRIKKQYTDAFLFFRLGDFYEMFFEDAERAAQVLEITLTSRAGGKAGEKIPMCGVPYHTSEPYIRKLIDNGYKVAICEQTEDPKAAKGVVKREVVRVITPGTLMEDSMLQETENNFMLFVTPSVQGYALIGCDLSTGETLGTVLNSARELLEEARQYEAAEIVVSTAVAEEDAARIRSVFQACWTESDEPDFAQNQNERYDTHIRAIWPDENDEKDRLTKESPEKVKILNRAISFMLYYIEKTQKQAVQHLQSFRYYEPHRFLMLDESSKRNLELVQTIQDNKRKGSLLWLLDQTETAMGGRLLKKWLVRPLMNRQQIEERLDIVQTMRDHGVETEELTLFLRNVYDLERLAARISYGNANPKDMLQLKKSLYVIPEIQSLLQKLNSPYLTRLVEQVDPCPDLVNILAESVRDDAPFTITEGGIFKEGYHEELDKLQEASKGGKRWIADLEARERKKTGIKSLKVGFNKVFGYYIEVTRANVHLLEEGRYERKQTLTNAERYITPELKEKEALILDASDRAMQLEHELFVALRGEVQTYTARLQQLAYSISQIDCLCAFAKISDRHHFVRPSFSGGKQMRLIEARHPVVENVLETGQFVANDLSMDPDQRQVLLITGPNMAGKSTYMRQVALISVMAQIGCFVPAAEAELPIFDRIFTRIGAADDLVGGQSTFMVEMVETKRALTEATENSLILLDEVGRGTSTYDGMSLAQSVVEYIHHVVRAKTLFSTHYHELTELENRLSRLCNVHVACSEQEGKVIFLHKVKEGKTDRSYGIHVAQLAGLPAEVIERASVILRELEQGTNGETIPLHQDQIAASYDGQSANEGSQQGNQRGSLQNGPSSALGQPEQLSLFGTPRHPGEEKRRSGKQADQGQDLAQGEETAFISEGIVNEIEQLDMINMTPLEALNTLYRLQRKIKDKQEV